MELSKKVKKRILKYQKDEITASVLYLYVSKKIKAEKNKKIFKEFSEIEKNHYDIWKKYTKKDVKPSKKKIFIFKFLTKLLGYTFVLKFFENGEDFTVNDYKKIEKEIPEVHQLILEEEEHENILSEMIDEERLNYVGAIVLGLNDALVELTGTIAGLTFALKNTRLVALSAIITGISATLSMAASNYLAERANNNPKAFKSSLYTGIAYLITVVLMVLPYLLLPNSLYYVAFIIMLAVVILIILLFNYYISVAKSEKFLKRFGEMALISLSVAAISFGIGILAKKLIGIDI